MKQIDSRLLDQLEAAEEEDEVEALVIVDRETAGLGEDDTDEGSIVARAVASSRQEPSEVRYMPTLGVLYVKGRERVLREILEDSRVLSASANADDFYVPGGSGEEE